MGVCFQLGFWGLQVLENGLRTIRTIGTDWVVLEESQSFCESKKYLAWWRMKVVHLMQKRGFCPAWVFGVCTIAITTRKICHWLASTGRVKRFTLKVEGVLGVVKFVWISCREMGFCSGFSGPCFSLGLMCMVIGSQHWFGVGQPQWGTGTKIPRFPRDRNSLFCQTTALGSSQTCWKSSTSTGIRERISAHGYS